MHQAPANQLSGELEGCQHKHDTFETKLQFSSIGNPTEWILSGCIISNSQLLSAISPFLPVASVISTTKHNQLYTMLGIIK